MFLIFVFSFSSNMYHLFYFRFISVKFKVTITTIILNITGKKLYLLNSISLYLFLVEKTFSLAILSFVVDFMEIAQCLLIFYLLTFDP